MHTPDATFPRNTIVCCGNIIQDISFYAPFAAKGTLAMATPLEYAPGGPVCNVSLGVAGLGLPVEAIGYVGDDDIGRALRTHLLKNGVRAEAVGSRPGSTSVSVIVVTPDGERTIYFSIGVGEDMCPRCIPISSSSTWGICHVGYPPLLPRLVGPQLAQFFRSLRALDVVTSLDTTWTASEDPLRDIAEALPVTSIFTPNFNEACQLTGVECSMSLPHLERMASFFVDRGVKVVVITLGRNGCYLKTGKGSCKNGLEFNDLFGPKEVTCYSEAYETSGGGNTTAAGDFFVAGLLTALMKGLDVETTLRVGNLVAAFHIERRLIPTLGDIVDATERRRRLQPTWCE